MWYLRSTLPPSASRISTSGCFFSSGESMMMRRDRPVTSSTSSCTVMPSMTSLNLDDAGFLGEDRERVRVPLEQDRARRRPSAPSSTRSLRAVDHLVALAVAALRVLDHDAAGAVHDDQCRRSASATALMPSNADRCRRACASLARLLGDARRRAADVERAHRQLRAGLADRLRGDDADRLGRSRPACRSPGRGRSTWRRRRAATRRSAPSGSCTFSMPASWIADASSSSISSFASTISSP